MAEQLSSSPSAPPLKTAVITGASSGIGLALTKHLLSLSSSSNPSQPLWRVILADINPPPDSQIQLPLYSGRAIYHPTNVASWQCTAFLFRTAYTVSSGRIDFFAANAGIDDRESVYVDDEAEEEGGPKEPNLTTLDVDLKSVFLGLKCFLHYARRTRRRFTAEGKEGEEAEFHPNMIVTSSCVALYHFPTNPQYCTAKAGSVALVRSISERLFQEDGVAVNAILPGFVATGLAPEGMINAWPKEHLTPMETLMRAYDELMDVPKEVGKERKRGECVECSQEKLYYRKQVEYSCWSMEWMIGDKGGFWTIGYDGSTGTGYGKRKRDDDATEEGDGIGETGGKKRVSTSNESVNGGVAPERQSDGVATVGEQ